MKNNIVNKQDYRYFFKKRMNYLTDKEKNDYMRENKEKCLAVALNNPNENWFAEKLVKNKIRHKRQCIWGFRIYDFWVHKLGCAIEIDGPEHNEGYDRYRDVYNYLRSGIVIIRVGNMSELDALEAIELIKKLGNWPDRRKFLKIQGKGIHPVNLTNPNSPYWES